MLFSGQTTDFYIHYLPSHHCDENSKLMYSGKLLREKTFAHWWKRNFARNLSLSGTAKRCHAPKFCGKNFYESPQNLEIRESFLVFHFMVYLVHAINYYFQPPPVLHFVSSPPPLPSLSTSTLNCTVQPLVASCLPISLPWLAPPTRQWCRNVGTSAAWCRGKVGQGRRKLRTFLCSSS